MEARNPGEPMLLSDLFSASSNTVIDEKKSKVLWVGVNGIPFGDEILASVFSIFSELFTPYDCSHVWLIIGLESETIVCMQFSKVDGDSSRREIMISFHKTEEEANKKGMEGVSGDTFRVRRQKRKVYDGITLQDILDYANNFDQEYSLLSNNCQSLAYLAYGNFSQDINTRPKYNKPGFTREESGAVTVVCNVM